jgi:hypothetical protein
MEILAELNEAEQLATRKFEVEELRAKIKQQEFKITVEAQYVVLQQDLQAKVNATLEHLRELAKAHELNFEDVAFDFDKLAFIPKKGQKAAG